MKVTTSQTAPKRVGCVLGMGLIELVEHHSAMAMLGQSLDELPAAGALPHSRRPAETPPRQKRRPNTSSGRRPQARPSPNPAARLEASHTPSTLQRHVSFAQVRPRSAHAPLTRHHSFEPRVGRRDGGSHHHGSHRGGSPHRPSSSAGSTGSQSSRRNGGGSGGGGGGGSGGGSSETAWAKLVARTQTLEEDLAGERASKRLLATRMVQEKQAVLDQLATSEEEHRGLQELWKHTNEEKDQMQKLLQNREQQWQAERVALCRELERLRLVAGEPPRGLLPPSATAATTSPCSTTAEDAAVPRATTSLLALATTPARAAKLRRTLSMPAPPAAVADGTVAADGATEPEAVQRQAAWLQQQQQQRTAARGTLLRASLLQWRHLPLAKCMRAWHDVVHDARLLRQLPSAADPLDPALGMVLPPVATADPAGLNGAGLAMDLAALTLHAGDLSSSLGPTELARLALQVGGVADHGADDGAVPQATQQVSAPAVTEHARGGLVLEDRPAAAGLPWPPRETRSSSGLRRAGHVAMAAA